MSRLGQSCSWRSFGNLRLDKAPVGGPLLDPHVGRINLQHNLKVLMDEGIAFQFLVRTIPAFLIRHGRCHAPYFKFETKTPKLLRRLHKKIEETPSRSDNPDGIYQARTTTS